MDTESFLSAACGLLAVPSTADRPDDLRRALGVVLGFVGPGFTVERFESGGKPSALVYRGAQRPRFRVILNAHLDVVPAPPDQFRPRREGMRLYARGAQDMKVSALVQAQVFRELAGRLAHPIALQLVTDEEVGGRDGTLHQLEQGVSGEFVIIGEHSGLDIVTESKGMVSATLRAVGRGAHGAYPWLGDNALVKLQRSLDKMLAKYPVATEEVWRTTVNLARIQTPNRARNQIPALAEAWLDIRFPPEDADLNGKTAGEIATYLAAFCEPGVTPIVDHADPPHRADPAAPRSAASSGPRATRVTAPVSSASTARATGASTTSGASTPSLSASAATASTAQASTSISPRSRRTTRRSRSSSAISATTIQPDRPARTRPQPRVLQVTGGGVPSALAASPGSHPQTMHAWRNAERANSRAAPRGAGLVRTSSQSRMYSPSDGVPVRGRRGKSRAREAVRRRVRVRVERRLAVSRITGPPADRDLLCVHRVAHDEVIRRGIGRQAGEKAHREVERSPPRVDRRRAPTVRRAERREDQRRLGRRGEIGGNLAAVVMRVLVVLVQRHAPRNLLRRRVDLHRAAQGAHRGQHLPGDRPDRAIGGERDTFGPAAAVLDHRLVDPQVERDDQRPGTVRRGQRRRLPPARGQPQRSVLQLRLRWGELRRQLAEHLGMRMQRVAGRAPLPVRHLRPAQGHDRTLFDQRPVAQEPVKGARITVTWASTVAPVKSARAGYLPPFADPVAR